MRAVLTATLAGLMVCGFAAAPCIALTCTASATGVPFGTYNPSNPTSLSGTGTVSLTCSALVSLLDTWTVALSSGNSNNYAQRQLKYGTAFLYYNLYTAASHAAIWGDGTAGTAVVTDTETLLLGTYTYNYTVYGQIISLQDKPVGSYVDTIAVTINY